MPKRAIRRARDERVVERRLTLLRRLGRKDAVRGGRWRKRHPLDCGNPRCQLCHWSKVFKVARRDERAASLAFEEQLRIKIQVDREIDAHC